MVEKYVLDENFDRNDSLTKGEYENCIFNRCDFAEKDFSESDLTGAVFEDCNLAQAIFDHSILEKADFRTAYNYSIDPEAKRIKKAKFSLSGISGLLDKYDIDTEK